jgi:hypothetical protein
MQDEGVLYPVYLPGGTEVQSHGLAGLGALGKRQSD